MKQSLLLIVFVLVAACPFTVLGQNTTATLNGLVSSEANEPLIGASIQATHTPTGKVYGTTTRADGRYTLANLRLGGPYTIEVTYVGFEDAKVDNIFLSLSEKRTLNIQVKSTAIQIDGLEITANTSGVISGDRTGAETTIDSKMIQNLPTISRNTSDYYRMNPAADGNSFGGRNDQFNNFTLDGSIFNNPFGLDAATPGGQTDASPVSLDAIDQIEVSIAPFDVTQAGFTGASVNAVTKSGTNEFHGTAFGSFRNEQMTSGKVGGTNIIVPDLLQYQAGASIGGPIVKDKVFFFANFEIDQRQDLGANVVANRAGLDAENVSRVDAADLDLISQTLFDRFGYETGPYEGYLFSTNSTKGLLKFDFNLNQNNTFSLTYNFLDAYKEKPAHPSALGRRGPDLTTLQFQNSGYRINNVIHSVMGELNTIIGNQFSNKLQVGYTGFRDSRDALSAAFPVININQDGIRYIVAGHEPFSVNNVLDQDVFQLTNNFNYYAGSHTLTAGFSFERFNFNNSFNLGALDAFSDGYGGTFGGGYPSVQVFVDSVNAGVLDDEVAFARATAENNNTNDSWALAETNLGQAALYFQDEWAVNTKLTITAGVRVDVPLYFDTKEKIQENIDRNCCYEPSVKYFNENGDSTFFDHTTLPSAAPLISPRLGFNYDVNGDKSIQLRGGTGLFTGRLPFVWIGNQVANPNWWFYNVTDPNFKYPQVWKTNLGYDHKLPGDWVVSADLIYTKDINGMMVRNYGLNKPTATLNSTVDNRPVYQYSDRALVFGTIPTNAYVFTNTNVGYSFNATFQVQKTWSNGLYASLAYNFLDSRDASSIEAEISSDAYDRNPALGHVNEAVLSPSLYGNRHRFVGSAYKRFEYENMATTVGLFFEAAQGGRFSYTYSGDINNDGSGLNDLIYIPTDGEVDQMDFAGDAAAQRTALKAFIAQDEYLDENRGKYAEKYAMLSPWYSTIDLRISQDFILDNEDVIQITLNVQNLGNMLNSNWGVRQFPVNTQPLGVSVDGNTGIPTYSFDANQTSTFANSFSLLSRWQAQIGARYIF